mgnify:CR=1 FL=1
MSDDLDLDKLEALAEASTPGPWKDGKNGGIKMVVSDPIATPGGGWRQMRADIGTAGGVNNEEADAAFIVASRTAVPTLVAEVRRLTAERDDAAASALDAAADAICLVGIEHIRVLVYGGIRWLHPRDVDQWLRARAAVIKKS